MENFTYLLPTKIIFGKDAEKHVGEEVKKYSSNVLLVHYGDDFIKKSGILETVKGSLDAHGIKYTELFGIQPNPISDPVYQGIDLCRQNDIDFILTIGGGSVIDTGKAVAVGVKYAGDVSDFYFAKAEPKEALPVGCIGTIPAAGSETSNGSVISFGEHKVACNSEVIRPRFALFDPELTLTLPTWQTFSGITDILDHVFERYFSSTKSSDLMDHMCEAAAKSIMRNARILVNEPNNYDARAEIMLAGSVAHNDMLSLGRMPDWGTHNIGHQLSVLYGVSHGASLSAVRPAWMRYNFKRDINQWVKFAVRIMGVEYDPADPERVVEEGIVKLENFYHEIGMPIRISELNLPEVDYDHMAELCGNTGISFSITADDVRKIYDMAK